MPNGAYWKKRMEAIEKMSHDKGADYAEYVKKQFEDSMRAMEKEIEVWYGRIADNNDISLAAAKKLLRKNELEDFHMTVKEYIKKGETLQYSDEWAKQLENASAKVHISRLEALKLQLRQKCEALYGDLENGLGKTMKGIYENGYYHTAYEIMKGRGVGYTFHRIDARRIEKAIDTVWAGDGKNFRARCWTNKEKLTNELQTVFTQSIIRGEAPDKAIKQLAKRMNVSKFSAGRLIMTESAFISSQSQKDCYRELDIEQFEFVATLDSLTSDICKEMDGQVFKMSDYEIGVNAPPLHCFCRSCTVPHFEDDFGIVGKRAARKENGETYYIPANMTYKQWQKSFVEGDNSGLRVSDTDDTIDFMDITNDWTKVKGIKGTVIERQEYIVNGMSYKVDGKHVILRPTEQEREVAAILSGKYGKHVEFIPQVMYPQGIQTPDYLIDGGRFDLKSPTGSGKNLLYGMIAKKQKQSHNFIVDATNCPLSMEELEKQAENLYRSPRVGFLDILVFIKDGEIVKVLSRK